ncbi:MULTISPECIES: EutN/CcmL family microcompartment protein [Clostridium]|uniref:Carbon dioxide concentrating mechanism protein CcmL n=2 Tax=Clostridium TaxID=1485 RepID=A0A151APE3_9CLOT|nr:MULTISPECIES: EutN/CcmL family microcompartment protein [Clostridium]KYH29498.1 carbon dioxide concentrating mechanism protein CcmL [Clostridium colicanis DSM 13634]PRR70743.1 Carbon dioxide concentrating mechanism protein CcmL [Clostridium thermopalmarium DSM 5974]PVZ22575.1 ethanolamine utilization protein EutN [Clostridium thermopalmarium DSM 5974]
MVLGKVVGTVVSTQKNEKLIGTKLLMVKLIDDNENIIKDKSIVAVDTAGSGIGDTVLIVKGSSTGSIYNDRKIPTDAAIVGIVDTIELDEKYK